ncbi:MAG: GYD domain-containing protein [Acidobacteriota bacterium]|nr:GYD domain-containing protein [Acidobacteriota bacterium]
MAKYMYQASYTLEGVRGLLKDTASGRQKAVESAITALGGKVEAFYYCFGMDDVVLIMDLPDSVAAAGLAMTVAASGMVRGRVTPLLTVAEADKALGVKIGYRAPGQP